MVSLKQVVIPGVMTIGAVNCAVALVRFMLDGLGGILW